MFTPLKVASWFTTSCEPYVELGAVATDGVRLHQCGNGVLCRAVGFPEAAVGDNLGGLCLYAAAGGKQ